MSKYIFNPHRRNVTEERIRREEKLADNALYGGAVAYALAVVFGILALISLWNSPSLTLIMLTNFTVIVGWVCGRIRIRHLLNPLGVLRKHLDRYPSLPREVENQWDVAVDAAILAGLEEELEATRIAVESARHTKWTVAQHQRMQEYTEQLRSAVRERIEFYKTIENDAQKEKE